MSVVPPPEGLKGAALAAWQKAILHGEEVLAAFTTAAEEEERAMNQMLDAPPGKIGVMVARWARSAKGAQIQRAAWDKVPILCRDSPPSPSRRVTRSFGVLVRPLLKVSVLKDPEHAISFDTDALGHVGVAFLAVGSLHSLDAIEEWGEAAGAAGL